MQEVKFTRDIAKAILIESEAPTVGHSGARHVWLSNNSLQDRAYMKGRDEFSNGKISIVTAFISFNDAVSACFDVLNKNSVQPQITELLRSVHDTRLALKHVRVDRPYRMRFSGHLDHTSMMNVYHMTIVLIRKKSSRYGFSIVTVFGSLPLQSDDVLE